MPDTPQHIVQLGRALLPLLLAAALGASASGCVSAQTRQPASGVVTVYAAASLRDAFQAIGQNFEAANPGAKVVFNFAGSQQLSEQIVQGAPADVFASANQHLMDTVVKAGRVDANAARVFARNRLVVVYPKSNPGRVSTLKDLARPGLKLVFANKSVPVGGYTLDFLDKASAQADYGAGFAKAVLANVVSYEEDVRTVFSKVALGEADAAVVYSSDVLSDKAAQVGKLNIPGDLNTIVSYPIAPLNDGPNVAQAQAFARYVLSPAAQAVLVKHGFDAAPGSAGDSKVTG